MSDPLLMVACHISKEEFTERFAAAATAEIR